jgi:L-threonylcarbamoyladenylate synthase
MDNQDLDKAVAILRRGGLVAFPTETVYGLGTDAGSPAALKKLYAAKGRPTEHPVIVHIADMAQLMQWAREITPVAQKLAQKFWPGPLTMLFKRAPSVSDAVTGGQDTVGIRIPSHPVAHALLKKFGGGVAAPSANRFGRVSATSADHVHSEFGSLVDFVFDNGQCDVGIESTIVDATGEVPVLLRPGHITAAEIEAAAGMKLGMPTVHTPRASGTLAAHYAPATSLLVMEGDLLLELAATLAHQGKRIAVLACSALQPLLPGIVWLAAPPDAHEYAHDLYTNLRKLDAADCDVILVEQLPQRPEWAAVNDRLGRAAAGTRPL